jgi:hypothetical protein
MKSPQLDLQRLEKRLYRKPKLPLRSVLIQTAGDTAAAVLVRQ